MTLYQPHAQVLATLDTEARWAFESTHRADIATTWAALTARQPALFNGPVLMAAAIAEHPDALQVRLLRTSYAAFISWRELNHPTRTAKLCFPVAALKTRDDFYLLGTMSAHTANAGLSYFPSGTLDDHDVLPDGTVALTRGMLREVEEETGLTAADVVLGDGWTRVENDVRCAFFKDARVKWTRAQVAERVQRFLACQPAPELAGIVFVKTAADLAGLRLPAVQREYFERVLPDR